ncbi:MAG: hypothetical protein PHI63_01815 [Patescibacteria group bacterium]|nr:hypothetical protein [Patescibacteria group bacterium]
MLAFAIGISASALALLAVALLAGAAMNLITRVPYAPTPPAQVERILDFLRLRPGQRLYDLGCGDGRVVFAASCRGVIATGYELQPLTYLRAKAMQLVRYRPAHIHFGNFQDANLADADIIFCFLVGAVMPKVADILSAKSPRGCTIVSYGFELPGWQPESRLESAHAGGSAFFIYRKK